MIADFHFWEYRLSRLFLFLPLRTTKKGRMKKADKLGTWDLRNDVVVSSMVFVVAVCLTHPALVAAGAGNPEMLTPADQNSAPPRSLLSLAK